MKERELLLPVRGIVGRIQIDRDARGAPLEPSSLMLDHGVGQDVRHVAQLPRAHAVLEPRERRVRGQRGTHDGIAVEEQLVQRIVGYARGIVAIGVATGDPKDTLTEQLEALVLDLAGLPEIDEAGRHPLGQLELGIEAFEQDGAAVRARIGHVERGDNRLAFRLESERELGYTGCGHRASSRECLEARRHRFYSTCERLGGSSLSSFVNFPG